MSVAKNLGPHFGNASLCILDSDLMNADENCYGSTGGGNYDSFNIPLNENGKSILTGMSRGSFNGCENDSEA